MPAEYNSAAHQNAIAEATANANDAYNMGMLQHHNDQLAFQKAQQAWTETMDKAGLTGMYEGQYTMPSRQWFAQQFGTWGAPTEGQQTLSGQQQTWQQAFDTAGQYGQYYGPGQSPAAGTQTLGAIGQGLQNAATVAGLTGYYNAPGATGQGTQTLAGAEQGFTQGLRTQQEQRAAQAQQQTQTQAYLQLLASLRGPADWAKYQSVLGATPNGMRDLYAAAMGQYVPGGGATTGYQPQAANLTTMMQQVQGQPVTWTGQGSVPQGQLNTADVYQGGQGSYGQQAQQYQQQMTPMQQQVQQMFQPQGQGMPQGWEQQQQAQRMQELAQYRQQNPQGAQNPTLSALQGQATAGQQAMQQAQAYSQQQQNAMGGGTNMMGANQPQAGQPAMGQVPQQQNLPAPNQIAPQSWQNLAPSQREMLMGQYEEQGWHKPDVEALFSQSLPKYAANAPTAGTFRLR